MLSKKFGEIILLFHFALFFAFIFRYYYYMNYTSKYCSNKLIKIEKQEKKTFTNYRNSNNNLF